MAQTDELAKTDSTDTEKNENEKKKESSIISKIGKIFLLIVGVFVSAFTSYKLVGHNYKVIHKYVYGVKKTPGVFYELKDIVVNPANTKGERYLLISLGIEIDNEKDMAVVKNDNPIIRDRIIMTLSKYTINELSSLNGRKELKKSLLQTINQVVKGNTVRNLFFTEYVMQ